MAVQDTGRSKVSLNRLHKAIEQGNTPWPCATFHPKTEATDMVHYKAQAAGFTAASHPPATALLRYTFAVR